MFNYDELLLRLDVSSFRGTPGIGGPGNFTDQGPDDQEGCGNDDRRAASNQKGQEGGLKSTEEVIGEVSAPFSIEVIWVPSASVRASGSAALCFRYRNRSPRISSPSSFGLRFGNQD